MTRPSRLFFLLLYVAEAALAVALLAAAVVLVYHRARPHPHPHALDLGLFTPQNAQTPPTGATTHTPTVSSSQEAPGGVLVAPPTLPLYRSTGPTITVVNAAVACGTSWQVTQVTPGSGCVLPDGTWYTPASFDCADGRQFIVGDPTTSGTLVGYIGGRLEPADREQAVELAAQCEGA